MQSYKDIAVYVDTSKDQQLLLDATAQLAARHDAHVTGVYAISPPSDYLGLTFDGSIGQDLLNQYAAGLREHAAEIQLAFEKTMQSAGVLSTWIVEDGYPGAVVPKHFRYADLGVVGQPTPEQGGVKRAVVNDVIFGSGRPVLIVPYIGAPDGFSKKTIVGWNAGQEAARALHDAMPFLEASESVDVVEVESHTSDDTLGTSVPVTEHLARHGIKATAVTVPKTNVSVGNTLLNRASDTGADLIVVGAWGHTRLREYMFGGVTRSMIDEMTVPVLMSH